MLNKNDGLVMLDVNDWVAKETEGAPPSSLLKTTKDYIDLRIKALKTN